MTWQTAVVALVHVVVVIPGRPPATASTSVGLSSRRVVSSMTKRFGVLMPLLSVLIIFNFLCK